MRILLDECVPRDLKFSFISNAHDCFTVQERGWAGKKNGELLRLAEPHFDVFVTLDKGIQFQQNLAGRKISVLLIGAKSNDISDILPHFPACLAVLQSIKPGEVVRVGVTKEARKRP